MAGIRIPSAARPRLTAAESTWLAAVARTVHEIDPSAQVILFGSQARGDASADSDWDVLVILVGSGERERGEEVRQRLAELDSTLAGTGSGLNLAVVSEAEWRDPVRRTWPFLANVRRDGLLIQPAREPGRRRAVRLRPIESEDIGMPQDTGPLVQHQRELAREALQAADLAAGAGLWSTCVNRLSDACFYAVSAWLIRRGLSSPRHTGIRSLFNQHLVRTGRVTPDHDRLYNDLFESRHRADYEALVRYTADQVRPWIGQTRRFMDDLERLLDRPDPAAEA